MTGEPIRDASGRVIAPPQPQYTPRPEGPWTQNGARTCEPS